MRLRHMTVAKASTSALGADLPRAAGTRRAVASAAGALVRSARLVPQLGILGGGPSRGWRCRGMSSDGEGSSVGGLDPQLEEEVPREQRPVIELASIRDSPLSSWANLEPQSLMRKLGTVWIASFALSAPVVAASYSPQHDTLEFLLSTCLAATAAQTIVLLRLHTTWSYVSSLLHHCILCSPLPCGRDPDWF